MPAVADTVAHRTGTTSPLGKFTADFPKWKGPELTHEMACRRAAAAGVSLAEWIRLTVMIAVHGRDEVESVYKAQLDVVEGKGAERGAVQ